MQEQLYQDTAYTRMLRYRWVVWLTLVATYMVSFFHRMSVSVVKEDLTATFQLSATEFGAMASMYFYAYCIAQIPSGILADTLGIRLTATISMILTAIATISFGFATSAHMLFISRFFVGVGVAASFVCVMKSQSQWFRQREFSTLSGICLFGGNLGSLLAQGPLALLVGALAFHNTFLAIGIFTLLLSVMCIIFVRNKPQDMGFPPLDEVKNEAPIEKEPLGKALAHLLTNTNLIPLYVYYFLSIPQLLAFGGTWSIAYLMDVYDYSVAQASTMASLQVLGFMAGSLIIGILSDKAGIRKPFLVYPNLLLALTWVFMALFGGTNIPPSLFLCCLFGVGFFTGSISVMMTMCKETVDRSSTGTAIAVLNSFGFLGIALATPLYGVILDAFTNLGTEKAHMYALIFVASITCAGFLGTLFSQETCKKAP